MVSNGRHAVYLAYYCDILVQLS